jgi:quinolinate synthase
MGGEIVKLVERYGGRVADSYQLALQAARNPEKKVIVESAVHFMAESIAILANDDQQVWITNPKAGCTMEMMAKDWMVLPAAEQLLERYGGDLSVVAYMNTGGRLKALAGRTGGAVCTSSNAHLVVDWVRKKGKKVLFVPDHHLGRNTAAKLGMDLSRLVTLPGPQVWQQRLKIDDTTVPGGFAALDRAEMILWGSYCGVHTIFTKEHVEWWRARGWRVIIHPESPIEAVQAADGSGSTDYLWKQVMSVPKGTKLAIGTEGHFVRNAREQAKLRGVEVMHLADIPDEKFSSAGLRLRDDEPQRPAAPGGDARSPAEGRAARHQPRARGRRDERADGGARSAVGGGAEGARAGRAAGAGADDRDRGGREVGQAVLRRDPVGKSATAIRRFTASRRWFDLIFSSSCSVAAVR